MSLLGPAKPKPSAVERAWVLVGQAGETGWVIHPCRPSSGQTHQVEADGRWALAREEARGDVWGFLHTHPAGGTTQPSSRDQDTMQAWCSSFGKPLLCLIRCGRKLSAWLFNPKSAAVQQLTVHRAPPNHYHVSPPPLP